MPSVSPGSTPGRHRGDLRVRLKPAFRFYGESGARLSITVAVSQAVNLKVCGSIPHLAVSPYFHI